MSVNWFRQGVKKLTEKKRQGRKGIGWVPYFLLSVVLTVYVFWKQGVFASGFPVRELMRVACDACFVCGLIFSCFLVINLSHYHGLFDFFLYGVSVFVENLFRRKEEESLQKYTDFATYLRQHEENKRLSKPCLSFAIGFLAAGTCCFLLYMNL